MQIVIVEDRPWKMKSSIQLLKQAGAQVKNVIFVTNNNSDDEQVKEDLQEMQAELGLKITSTDHYGFEKIMDKFYADEKNLFFCDLNLNLNKWIYFGDRENVRYATKIMEKENGLKRIWFYTTAGESTNEQINANFPQRNITVETVGADQQVILDMKQVKGILEEYLH